MPFMVADSKGFVQELKFDNNLNTSVLKSSNQATALRDRRDAKRVIERTKRLTNSNQKFEVIPVKTARRSSM